MLTQFFCARNVRTLLVAWLGVVVVVGHSVFKAWINGRLNAFFGSFYDLLQSAAVVVGGGSYDYGSGSGSEEVLRGFQEQVQSQLLGFFLIVAPLLVVNPVASLVKSTWIMRWRIALLHSYLRAWDSGSPPLEGAAQRAHEDTMRLARGVETCLVTVLDSACTLVVFAPVLLDLGSLAPAPQELAWMEQAWLLAVASLAASMQLAVAWFVGRDLVTLEVNNQRVEGELRTRLVMLETSYAAMSTGVPPESALPPPHDFASTISRLRRNYMRLFGNFFKLNLFLSSSEQMTTLLPYFLIAPMLFNRERRVTLGVLTRITNSFSHVFSALAVISERWADVNDFRSTVRRLIEFERVLLLRSPLSSKGICYTEADSPPPPSRRNGRSTFAAAATTSTTTTNNHTRSSDSDSVDGGQEILPSTSSWRWRRDGGADGGESEGNVTTEHHVPWATEWGIPMSELYPDTQGNNMRV